MVPGYPLEKGFTLVECLIVVAVFGILIAAAAPPMSRFMQAMQARQNTNDLMSSLLLARSEAVTRNVNVTMCMIDQAAPGVCDNSKDWEDGWIAFEDLDRDGIRDVGEDVVDEHSGMDNTTVVTTANFATSVRYTPSGAVWSAGNMTICVAGEVARRIFINATGRPRMADGACP